MALNSNMKSAWHPTTLQALLVAAGMSAVLLPGHAIAKDLQVVATIKPLHALVAQVMGDTGAPTLLVQGAASPHTYSLKPSDAKALHGADVVFRVSESIEPFTRKIVASLPKSVRVSTLAEAAGLTLLDTRTGDTFESHDHPHDHDAKKGKSHTKAKSQHDHHDDHGHADHDAHDDQHKGDHHESRDGHVWLDPQNGIAMVREIARVLKEASPADATQFDANAAQAIADIEKTAAEIEAIVQPVRGKPYVVFHDAYQYFEARFGIPAIGAITVSPEVQPSAKRLTEIRAKIKALNAVCVFAEPQFKSKLVATVLEGTEARAGTLDPEGAALDAGPSAYSALLKNLAQQLASCLSGPA